jgi:hypothetical protein
MKPPRKTLYIPGAILFYAGILLGLILSGWSLWGNVEASVLVFRTGEQDLSLRCPMLLVSSETGMVSADFANPTEDEIRPTVKAVIGREGHTRMKSTVLTIAPGAKTQLQWTVGPADEVFGGLILVNVFETSQRNFPSHQGSCGIPVWSLPLLRGQSGIDVFVLLFLASLIGMAGGAALWVIGNSRLKGLLENATNASAALALLVFLDMVLTFPRWWGLSLLLFLLTLMLVVIIVTQFMLFPTDADRGER